MSDEVRDYVPCSEPGCKEEAIYISSYWPSRYAMVVQYWCDLHGPVEKRPIEIEIQIDKWDRVKEQIYRMEDLQVTNKPKRITRNAIRCNICGAIIESKHRHDFVVCDCGLVSVDGGLDYMKRGFSAPEDYTELSEIADE